VTRADDFTSVKIGDVVAFRAAGLKGEAALHRVIAISGGGSEAKLYVKGDNNPQADGAPVTKDNYIGRAVFNTNLTAGYIAILNSPGGKLKAIVLPTILLLLLYFGARWLIGSASNWRSKGLAIAIVILLISASVLLSYTLYTIKQVNATNEGLGKVARDFGGSSVETSWTVSGKTVIGRIEIPSLKLDYPIIDYSAATSLNTTIAQFSGAGVNEPGNEVLVGHRTYGDLSPFNLFFTKIDELKVGDEIILTGLDRESVTYTVTWLKTVAPSDTSVLDSLPAGARTVTLIATTFDLQHRFVVRAEE
jgi:LPXTG-site transpeptidase (sortase) family protein